MISALIPNHNSEQLLVHSLSALVSASAEGILKEVIIADAGSADDSQLVADTSGARWISTTNSNGSSLLPAAQNCKRSDWVLLIQPGMMLQPGWQNEASIFIERAHRTRSPDNLIGLFLSATEEFGNLAQIKQRLLTLKHRLMKTSCTQLPILVQRSHLLRTLNQMPDEALLAQLQQILRTSRIHWLNTKVTYHSVAK